MNQQQKFPERRKTTTWNSEKCRKVTEKKNTTKSKIIKYNTKSNKQKYPERGRPEKQVHKNKKQLCGNKIIEEIQS